MSTLGKGIRSIRKKDLQTQKSMGVGVKKLVFYHQASAGDTSINLTALSMPSALSALGKTNPSIAALGAARLAFFQDNFTLVSSLKGILMPGSYVVTSSTSIQLQYTALANEIFIGYLDNVIQPSLRAVDARVSNMTTTLAQGQTDVTFNDIFVTNLYPTQQVGAVLVFRNGKLQMRNTNNVTASVTADGNYQEVPTSGPTGNLIRFNVPVVGPGSDSIMIVSNGALVERPTDSQMGYIETLAGQVNSMIPVLADAAGVPTSTFGSNPTSVDLRTFGDSVIGIKSSLNTLIGTYNPTRLVNFIQFTATNGSVASNTPVTPSNGTQTVTLANAGLYRIELMMVAQHNNNYTSELAFWTLGGTASQLGNAVTPSWQDQSQTNSQNLSWAYPVYFSTTGGQTVTLLPTYSVIYATGGFVHTASFQFAVEFLGGFSVPTVS